MKTAATLMLFVLVCGCVTDHARWVDDQATRDPVLTDPERTPWIYPGVRKTVRIYRKLAEQAYREGWEIGLRHGNDAVGTRSVAPFHLNGPERQAWEKAFQQGVFAGAGFRNGHDGAWVTEQLDRQRW